MTKSNNHLTVHKLEGRRRIVRFIILGLFLIVSYWAIQFVDSLFSQDTRPGGVFPDLFGPLPDYVAVLIGGIFAAFMAAGFAYNASPENQQKEIELESRLKDLEQNTVDVKTIQNNSGKELQAIQKELERIKQQDTLRQETSATSPSDKSAD